MLKSRAQEPCSNCSKTDALFAQNLLTKHTIPYGETRTYGELAAELGSSPRAIGTAVGKNPISVIVPCHRVLGADGSLTGYAGGLDRKETLLELEGALPFVKNPE